MANHLAVPPVPLGGSSFLTPGMASGLTQMWTENHFRHIKPPTHFPPQVPFTLCLRSLHHSSGPPFRKGQWLAPAVLVEHARKLTL